MTGVRVLITERQQKGLVFAPIHWTAQQARNARIDVYAVTLEPEMVASIERAAGHVVHHARRWSLEVFATAAIALADLETDVEAQAFYCAARAAGVPVNVLDKPAFCQFQFGSIVNRSPVVVAISTDGAAPILVQAIRGRIETLLPPSWPVSPARRRPAGGAISMCFCDPKPQQAAANPS